MDSTLTLEAEAISTPSLVPATVTPTTRTSGSTALLTYKKLDREGFETIADGHPDVVIPLEQTPDWIDFKTAVGRRPLGIWAYRNADGDVIATASFVHVTRRFRESVVVVFSPSTRTITRRSLGCWVTISTCWSRTATGCLSAG